LLPDSRTLTLRLTAALGCDRHEQRPVKILRRTLPPFMCTFPNEIVTCQLPDGRKRRVFIKYQAGQSHECYGHRGDVPYEAEVYRRLLHSLPNFKPKCLGAHADPDTGDISLFLEYVYRSVRLSDIVWKRLTRQPRGMTQAASWIGKFHAVHEQRIEDPLLAFLRRYNAEYYRGWAQRTFEFSRPLHGRFPWLTKLYRADEWFAPAGRAADRYSRRVLRQDHLGSKPKRIHGGLGVGRNRGRGNRLGGADGRKTLARRRCAGMRACLRTRALA